jgi:hypothetical protein
MTAPRANIYAVAERAELDELRAADRLHVEDLGEVGGDVTIELPMPGIARLRIT